ncbi:MAG: hypothetical protein SV375_12680, partial [Thermodesulfobacteriota bacterium]|nr:hypothetical protein [Thermodesulfobacteriota bacterium]
AILRSTGMRGFGPNSLGIVNTSTGLTTSYFSNYLTLRPGNVGLIGQSGIFVGALLHYLSSFETLRISKAISLGNKVEVDEIDALNYLMEDEQTRVVGMYLEDIKDGRRFLEEARKAVIHKPVLLLKGGSTPEGAHASASHTASMAVDDAVLNGALNQIGVLRMGGMDELVETLMGFLYMPLPRGNRIAIVSYSGAQAIMSVDTAIRAGFMLASFADETRERLSRVIPTPSKAQNPIDIYPDMLQHGFEKTNTEILRALLEDQGVDGIIFIAYTETTNIYRPLVEVIQEYGNKPVFFSVLGMKEEVEEFLCFFGNYGIPSYRFPEMAIRVLANMLRYTQALER